MSLQRVLVLLLFGSTLFLCGMLYQVYIVKSAPEIMLKLDCGDPMRKGHSGRIEA